MREDTKVQHLIDNVGCGTMQALYTGDQPVLTAQGTPQPLEKPYGSTEY